MDEIMIQATITTPPPKPRNNLLPSEKTVLTLGIIGAVLALVSALGLLSIFIFSFGIGYILFFILFPMPIAGVAVSSIGYSKAKKYYRLGGEETKLFKTGRALSACAMNANVFLLIMYFVVIVGMVLFVVRIINFADSFISLVSSFF